MSLWDIIETPTWHLVNYSCSIERFRTHLEDRRHGDRNVGRGSGAFTVEDHASLTVLLDGISPWLETLILSASVDRAKRIREIPNEGHNEYAVSGFLVTQLEVLTQTLEDELRRHVFLPLPSSVLSITNKNTYSDLTCSPILGPGRNDVKHAGNCYAQLYGLRFSLHARTRKGLARTGE